MAETAQINPKIKLATKVRLLEFCKDRGHAQGEVVEAALEAYFTPADGDAQTLMFQKINGLEQGMKDVVTLLGSVIQHLEQHAKPPPPKVATRAELYPELEPAVVATAIDPAATLRALRHTPPMIDVAQFVEAEVAPTPPTRSSWWTRVYRKATP